MIVIEGNELEKAIKICTLRGKYNDGRSNKTGSLSSNVVIKIDDDVYFQNANEFTYVCYRADVVSHEGKGTFIIDTDILLKYIVKSENMELHFGKNLEVRCDGSIITIPPANTHTNINVVEKLGARLRDLDNRTILANKDEDGVAVTDTLKLKTVVNLRSDNVVKAVNLAERVGNSIYKLDWSYPNLNISSSENNQKVETNVEGYDDSTDRDATVELSLPISNIIKDDDELVILFDDERPTVFANRKVTVLRAPRLRN
tara:strand:- start:2321 stop:3094 length:774 start_codon:yes stop_codon:yes gene_type:complete